MAVFITFNPELKARIDIHLTIEGDYRFTHIRPFKKQRGPYPRYLPMIQIQDRARIVAK